MRTPSATNPDTSGADREEVVEDLDGERRVGGRRRVRRESDPIDVDVQAAAAAARRDG